MALFMKLFEFETHVLWTRGLTGTQRHSMVCAPAHVYDVEGNFDEKSVVSAMTQAYHEV